MAAVLMVAADGAGRLSQRHGLLARKGIHRMKKRSREYLKALARRKRRHADSSSNAAPDPRHMTQAMANAMRSGSSSGRSTIATSSTSAAGK